MSLLRAFSILRRSSSSLGWSARASLFWVFWIRKTIRNVTIVVPVLITSCQVSEKPNYGSVTSQATMISAAARKAIGCPAACEVHLEKREKGDVLWGASIASGLEADVSI